MAIDTRKLKSARVFKDFSQIEMAHQMNMSLTNYRDKENGKREFTSGEINSLISILDLVPTQVYGIFFASNLTNRLSDEQSATKETA